MYLLPRSFHLPEGEKDTCVRVKPGLGIGDGEICLHLSVTIGVIHAIPPVDVSATSQYRLLDKEGHTAGVQPIICRDDIHR